MKQPSSPICAHNQVYIEEVEPAPLRSPILRLMVWFTVLFWYTSEDWRDKRPFLARTTAHVTIIALAIATLALVGTHLHEPRARVSAGGLADADKAELVASSPVKAHSEPALPTVPDVTHLLQHTNTVSRLPVPHTNTPARPRAEVIIYVVQPGDTLFTVAERYGLATTTIVWSNQEAFRDVPWLLRVGTELYIMPVDGVYHTVRGGETVASIAAAYGVDSADLLNEWNDLYLGNQPREGQRLVIPGGKGEKIDWQPLITYPAPAPDKYSVGVCNNTMVIGPSGHGWFTYPTGRTEVSGWVFHDRRRPTHIGLDYDCAQGDPIYAADNGVVTMAGRNGTYGNMIEINHGGGFVTRYGHLDTISVKCGHPVYQGDLIGTCGTTGWSTGPHLHFEIRQDNVPLDPESYLPPLDSD
jgi:murein DD-endopeptidase MepM/ murein hydrolase activator NlpD